MGQVCRQRVSIGGFGARPHHTKSSEASRGAQSDRRMTESRVRSVGAVLKKSEINCKTTDRTAAMPDPDPGCSQMTCRRRTSTDKPHYVNSTTPCSSDESQTFRVTLTYRARSSFLKYLDANRFGGLPHVRTTPFGCGCPRHAPINVRFTMDLPAPMW